MRERAALSHLTWFKVGGEADFLFKPADFYDLATFMNQNNEELAVNVLGAGSNIIVRDGGVDGVVVKLARGFTYIEILNDTEIVAGGACLNFNLATFCRENNFSNLEFLIGIPGTLGGGVKMNAGSYGSEFKDVVTKIEGVSKEGKQLLLDADEIGFGYRNSNLPNGFIVTKVYFKVKKESQVEIAARMQEINDKRASSQPIKEKTGGSTFANGPNYKAWQLIDAAGMRGYKLGGAEISSLHCNFMINTGVATAKDLEDLGELVRSKVQAQTGILLNWEIKRIGRIK